MDDIRARPDGPGSQGFAPEPAAQSRPIGADPSRVLFLDIDGVVLSGRDLWHSGNNRYLPPAKIALVKEVCDRTGAVVVVSSTWRYSDETADMLRFAGLRLHPDWRTEWRNKMTGLILHGQTRGVEIGRWLARHNVAAFAIVDDDSDMLVEQVPYFVQTKHEDGIEREHVERLVAILSPSPNPHGDRE